MSLVDKLNNKNKDCKIALDGPSASGKGLIGSMLAEEFGLHYHQSSILYRGLAYICLEDKINLNYSIKISNIAKNTNIIARVTKVDLGSELIGEVASKISVITDVRKYLTQSLTKIVQDTSRIIMEGRDIGTTVMPNADVKIFISADVEVRAMRRYKQLQLQGKDCTIDEVLESLKKRDYRDTNRLANPLSISEHSIFIDTSDLTPLETILKIKKNLF